MGPRFRDAQIEVNAHVTDASINFNTGTVNPGSVHIINTATNQIVGSRHSGWISPVGVSVSPGRPQCSTSPIMPVDDFDN